MAMDLLVAVAASGVASTVLSLVNAFAASRKKRDLESAELRKRILRVLEDRMGQMDHEELRGMEDALRKSGAARGGVSEVVTRVSPQDSSDDEV